MNPSEQSETFPPLERFSYLLSEMEAILASEAIDWSTADCGSIYARLNKVAQSVSHVGAKVRDQP
jgi:hypothetical protein